MLMLPALLTVDVPEPLMRECEAEREKFEYPHAMTD
jgi:hypothetical protein